MDNISISENNNLRISETPNARVQGDPNVIINSNIVQISEDISIQIGTTETLPPDSESYVVNSGDDKNVVLNFGLVRGQSGSDGLNGTDGIDGISPIATVTQTASGATISITDVNGTTNANIYNGTDGTDGINGISPIATVTPTASGATISITDQDGTTTADIDNGIDGFSPIITTTQTSSGYDISITDVNGTTTASLYNGFDGTDGTDGFSPIATVTQTASGADISITDINGTTTASVLNGTNGTDGTDGFSPIATVTPTASGATISITDEQGTTTANITNGVNGTDGTDGFTPVITATAAVDSATGTPSVSVYKTGTDEYPQFDFAFSGLKGETGASGVGITTKTDSGGRIGYYFDDGLLICRRTVTFNVAINNTWGSLYRGVNPDFYSFAPSSGTDFIEKPTVSITALAGGTSSYWLGAWENGAIVQYGTYNMWSIPTGSLSFIRPSSSSSTPVILEIIAIGKWK